MIRFLLIFAMVLVTLPGDSSAQTLSPSQFKLEWKVINRFRLFSDENPFKLHENAWRQYQIYIDQQGIGSGERDLLLARSSVLGSERVLNDRFIAFSNIPRKTFDWRGWAAGINDSLCYNSRKRRYSACGSLEDYLLPKSHAVELWLSSTGGVLPAGVTCEWRIDGTLVAQAPCEERVSGENIVLPYPLGADISVNLKGETPILVKAQVKDLLIAGLGDSFASGEGNPNVPVTFDANRRFRNFYPERRDNDASGDAVWTDTLCHRSLYGAQLRAALQIAVENPQVSITFLDYSCSGAGIEAGILNPQTYVERQFVDERGQSLTPPYISGGPEDGQLFKLIRDLCRTEPEMSGRVPLCPGQDFRRPLDLLFLTVGGNDIGFSNIVAWASLREGVSAKVASFIGATVSAEEFSRRMRDILPSAYAELAAAFESSLPLVSSGDGVFDPSRVILSAYPDLVTDETGGICKAAPRDAGEEDRYPANQSLDMFSSWLTARASRLEEVREQFSSLHRRMRDLAGDHGWTFAGSVYRDRMFDGHGFCAQDLRRISDPAEQLMIPCFGTATRDTETCQTTLSGTPGKWRPYDPSSQNFPFVLRQRWVRTLNDAYMVVNQKVKDRSGRIDEEASSAVFSETTGALHPTAEGHAVLADSLMLTLRPMLYDMLYGGR